MSEIDVKQIIAKPESYNVIRILRDGPLQEATIIKYLETAPKLSKKNITKTIKELEKHNLITSFSIKQDIYYILIKDFYVIRIPPKELLEQIQKRSSIPKGVKERFLMAVKRYFSGYVASNRKLISDFEADLIAILVNTELSNLINELKKKPMDLKSFQKKCSDYGMVKDILGKFEIIDIIGETERSKDVWVFLKTDLHLRFFFPEYLIKTVTEKLRDKKLNKILALKSLYALKRSYLISEKPKMFETLNERIENKLELALIAEKKGEKPLFLAKELKKLYKDVGDYDNRMIWLKRIVEWQK